MYNVHIKYIIYRIRIFQQKTIQIQMLTKNKFLDNFNSFSSATSYCKIKGSKLYKLLLILLLLAAENQSLYCCHRCQTKPNMAFDLTLLSLERTHFQKWPSEYSIVKYGILIALWDAVFSRLQNPPLMCFNCRIIFQRVRNHTKLLFSYYIDIQIRSPLCINK